MIRLGMAFEMANERPLVEGLSVEARRWVDENRRAIEGVMRELDAKWVGQAFDGELTGVRLAMDFRVILSRHFPATAIEVAWVGVK